MSSNAVTVDGMGRPVVCCLLHGRIALGEISRFLFFLAKPSGRALEFLARAFLEANGYRAVHHLKLKTLSQLQGTFTQHDKGPVPLKYSPCAAETLYKRRTGEHRVADSCSKTSITEIVVAWVPAGRGTVGLLHACPIEPKGRYRHGSVTTWRTQGTCKCRNVLGPETDSQDPQPRLQMEVGA